MADTQRRRLPIGTEVVAPNAIHARVWAPDHELVTLVLEAPERREIALARDAAGYHAALVDGVGVGARYRFKIGDQLCADPASRFQPEGPHGPSQVVDPSAFAWTDGSWRGVEHDRHVLYEMHVGTFTPEGTWEAATAQLPFLAELGVTTLELMPVNEFAGRRNWGYDGVNLFAPTRAYGAPDDMRRFIDTAHRLRLAVIIDVVYNHFGPDGNSLFHVAPRFKTAERNEWGDALAFDEPGVREFFTANAGYWIGEYHADGLRLDATQAIPDDALIGQIAAAARAAGGGRKVFVVGENEPQNASLVTQHGLDALWNDDFHHTARVRATGVIDGYLHDYSGSPQELVSASLRGFLYQGQMYPWQRNPRGSDARAMKMTQFVHFLENHDQVANVGFGERLGELCDPATLRALTALLLLGPGLPMLFQGQETGSRAPWRFFADHKAELVAPIREGRASFVTQFQRLATPEAQAALSDPSLDSTFQQCVLDPRERDFARPIVALHRDLLALRRTLDLSAPAGAVLGHDALALRYGDRLLLVNLGHTFVRGSLPEPLLAPPPAGAWEVAWSSEHPRYGGHGTPPVFTRARMLIPARAAVMLAPEPGASLREDHVSKEPPES